MNIALPALIVFAILVPGFIVRSRFKRAERASLDYSPFGQVAIEAVLWAIVLHAVWLAVAALAFDRWLRIDVLLKLITSDGATQSLAIDAVGASAGSVAAYFATLFAFATVAPTLARQAITRGRLDREGARFSWLLRFHHAPWYYLLTGADFERDEEPDLIAVSAVVNVAGQPVLYTGILADFFMDTDGRLDRLVLAVVMRRPLASDKPAGATVEEDLSRFYAVDGDYFVLRYREAITLNVKYIKFQADEAPADVPLTP